MNEFEERNNDDKEQRLIFETEDGNKIRMLGSYLGFKEDVNMRLKRGGGAWFKVKKESKRIKNIEEITGKDCASLCRVYITL